METVGKLHNPPFYPFSMTELVYPLELVKDLAKKLDLGGSVADYYKSIPVSLTHPNREQIMARTAMMGLSLLASGHDLQKEINPTRLTPKMPVNRPTLNNFILRFAHECFDKNGPGFMVNLELSMILLAKLAKNKNPWELYVMCATGFLGKSPTLWEQFQKLTKGVHFEEKVVIPNDAEIWTDAPRKSGEFFIFTGYPVHAVQTETDPDCFSITLRIFVDSGLKDISIHAPSKVVTAIAERFCPDIYNYGPIRGKRITVVAESGSPLWKYMYTAWYPADKDRTLLEDFASCVFQISSYRYDCDGYDMGEVRYAKKTGGNWTLGVSYWAGVAVPFNVTKFTAMTQDPQMFVYISSKGCMINLGSIFGFNYSRKKRLPHHFSELVSRIGTTVKILKQTASVTISLKQLMTYLKRRMGKMHLKKYLTSITERLAAKAQDGQISLWEAAWLIASEEKGANHVDTIKLSHVAGEAISKDWKSSL